MSSKSHSESSATAQEELQKNLSAAEEVASSDVTLSADISDAADDNDQPDEESSAGSEFKVTDKRRVTTGIELVGEDDDDGDAGDEEEEEDPDDEESGSISSDAFEIDLDQLRFDEGETEREIEELRDKLKESEVKLKEFEARREEAIKTSEEYADRFRKAQVQLRAEADEMRARMQRTFDQRLEIARGDLVASLLDTLDNLQRAVVAAEIANEQGPAFIALRDGVKATAELFDNQLKKLGLQAVPSEGEQFNPEIHDAVEIAPTTSEQDNLVLAELQRGYKFGERLLRPARVKVGRA